MKLTGARWWLFRVGVVLVLVAGLGPVAWQVAHPAPPGKPLIGFDDPRLVRHAGEEELRYITRASDAIAGNVEHLDTHFARQTWEVAFLDTITRGRFTGRASYGEGIINPQWLRRGICSQHAIALAEVLRRNGVSSADAYQVDRHVIVQFTHEEETWVVDPDLGVAPFAVDWSDPEQLRDAARVAYADFPTWRVQWAESVFSDTSGDGGAYPRDFVEPIVAMQARVLHRVGIARWVAVGLGVALLGAALWRRKVAR